MSRLAEYRALELKIQEEMARLEALGADDKLKVEMQFEEKLKALMSKYDKSLRDIISILDPQSYGSVSTASAKTDKAPRRERELKIYEHPETKERVETKGGNHTVLKAWKAEHGADVVETWRVQ